MSRSLKDVLNEKRIENIMGREREVETLLGFVTSDNPAVVHVHGLGGIGKTSLLAVFVHAVRKRGFATVDLDCRNLEPSAKGLLTALANVLDAKIATIDEAAAALSSLGDRVVLALDSYEMYRMVDTWLREVFLPALKENTRVFLFGRERPVPVWLVAPEWQGILQTVMLGPLDDEASAEILKSSGIAGEEVTRIVAFANGHPLALRLAATAIHDQPELDIETITSQKVIFELTRTWLADVKDLDTRYALEAASVVRRMTKSMLSFFLPSIDADDVFERMCNLTFVDSNADGLVIHDSVQQAIVSSLEASDPARYGEFRRKAWRFYRNEVKILAQSEIWHYSADMLYLVEEPLIREAFFPSNLQQFAMESAKPRDHNTIRDIITRFEGSESARALLHWLEHLPENFTVARDKDGSVKGFYLLINPKEVQPGLLRSDPVTWSCVKHLEHDPIPANQEAIFCRRWLDSETGEGLSPVVSQCFLDLKGYYVAMKPKLRRLYCIMIDYNMYADLFKSITFTNLKSYAVNLDGNTFHPNVLDFGPALFNGWITKLVGLHLGVDEGDILDVDACEIVIDGKHIGLTPLELGVMQYLEQHEGDVVKRVSLLENVWGFDSYSGSNVVDTKISSIRKKMGDFAPMIETVSGIGYRYKRI